MPSPFPGMDPFLEDPAHFPDLHDGLIVFIQQDLQPRLPRPYYAASRARVWIETTGSAMGPDIEIFRPLKKTKGKDSPSAAAQSSSPVVVDVLPEEHRQVFLEVFIRKDRRDRLVTSIEVISPTNKARGQHGRKEYRRKQREVLRSKTHLVEIDLLRGGLPTTAVPRDLALAKAGRFDYHICVRRFNVKYKYFVYPILLQQRLPVIDIPLLPGDPSVPVDLHVLFDRAYEACGYERRVDYAKDAPVPPLAPEQAEWASQLLREKGLLPRRRAK